MLCTKSVQRPRRHGICGNQPQWAELDLSLTFALFAIQDKPEKGTPFHPSTLRLASEAPDLHMAPTRDLETLATVSF